MKKLLFVALMSLSLSAFSQVKLGHINSNELMRMMPELDSAEQSLQSYARDIETEMRTLQTELQNLYNEFTANQNQYSELIKQTKIKALQDREARLQDFSEQAQKDIDEQKTKLFNPIIEKAKAAIAEVAKENKFSYIFDTSTGQLLFSNESDDIMALVKKKLGLK